MLSRKVVNGKEKSEKRTKVHGVKVTKICIVLSKYNTLYLQCLENYVHIQVFCKRKENIYERAAI